jgi:hypothetical protein
MPWFILGKLEVEYTPIDPESFILGAILGFLCSFAVLVLAVLIIWAVKKMR